MRLRIAALVALTVVLVATGTTWPHALALDDRLTWWSGQAYVTAVGAAEMPAVDGMVVHEGDLIRAADEGRVTIAFRDGSLASLEPGTTVRVDRATVADGAASIALRVERGHLWSSLPRNGYGRIYAVAGPAMTATATGTAFDVVVEGERTTLMTAEGTVRGAGGAAVAAGAWQRADAGHAETGITTPERMMRFSADAGSRLIVTDPFGRSCGDVPGIGELRQIPGCLVSRATDPVLVDLRDVAWSGGFVVSVLPGPSRSVTVGVATMSSAGVTSRGSVSAGGAGMLGMRVDVVAVADGVTASGMTALAPMASAPVRAPALPASPPGPAVAFAATPDATVFPPMPTASAGVTLIPVSGTPLGLPSATPAPPIAVFPLPSIPLPGATASPSIAPVASPTPAPFETASPPPSAAPVLPSSPAPTVSSAPSTAPGPTPAPSTPAPTTGPPPATPPAPTATASTPPGTTPTSTGSVAMTNVAGAAVAGADCPTPTAWATCATLFALAGLRPGDADALNTVTIAYHGTETVTLRVYAAAIETRASGSSLLCTAADPAAAIDLRISGPAGAAVYPVAATDQGDLSDFAAAHGDPATAVAVRASGATSDAWHDGDSATFTLAVRLDAAAGNDHQGCASSITLAWYASP